MASNEHPSREQLLVALRQALDDLHQPDFAHLFDVDVNERAITHHLAVLLARRLESWNVHVDVDVEWNRDGRHAKWVWARRTSASGWPIRTAPASSRTSSSTTVGHGRTSSSSRSRRQMSTTAATERS